MKISLKLNIILCSFLVLTGGIIGIFYWGSNRLQELETTLRHDIARLKLVDKTLLHLFKLNTASNLLRQQNIEFDINRQPQGLSKLQEFVNSIYHDSPLADEKMLILDKFTHYYDTLFQLKTAVGFTENDALRGKMRSAAHTIETLLAQIGHPELNNHLLLMRRHEKDFLIRNSEKYIERLNFQKRLFQKDLNQTEIPKDKLREIELALSTYVGVFSNLAKDVQKFNYSISQLNLYSQSLHTSLEDISADLNQRLEQDTMAIENTELLIGRTVMLSTTLFSLFILCIITLLKSSIARNISLLNQAVLKLSQGEENVIPEDIPADETGMIFINTGKVIDRFKDIIHKRTEAEQEAKENLMQIREQEEEMRAINEELQQQTLELRKSEAKMGEQQEELKTINQELTTKADLLKQQQQLLQQKHDELERSSQYKSEFLANMSHEFRTPLNSILILSELLADKTDDQMTEKEREFAQTIYQSGSDLLHLINDILDLSKVESGQIDLHLETMNFTECFKRLQNTFQPLADKKGLQFLVEQAPEVPQTISTDIQRVEQIVKNFLSNAIKFTETGHVTIRLETPQTGLTNSETTIPAGELVCIKVSDTGKGIAPDKLDLIFEAFHQEDGSIRRKFGGTGLGLSISRQLAQILGGEVSVDSQLGHGSCFCLTLPLKAPNKTAAERPVHEAAQDQDDLPETTSTPAPSPSLPEPDAPLLLIVDHDEEHAERLAQSAEGRNIEALVSSCADEALNLAAHMHPSAVVFNSETPNCDNFINRVRQSPWGSSLPIWVVGDADYGSSTDVKASYCKPLTEAQITTILESLQVSEESQLPRLVISGNDQELIDRLQTIISFIGADIRIANGSDDLKKLLVETPADGLLLVLDKDRPFERLETLRRENTPLPPIIACSGQRISSDLEKSIHKYTNRIVIMTEKCGERLRDEIHSLAETQAKETAPPEPPADIFDAHILLVDDDPRNVYALSQSLQKRGFNISVAFSGQEALEQIKRHQFDLILMDVMMPEMDGMECTRRIREHLQLTSVPILAVTAKAMKGDREKCIAAGFNDYITKPVQMDKLFELIKLWVQVQ